MTSIPETLEPPRPPLCPKCHRAVDRLDPNTQRNPETRKWEHKDCRESPRWTGRLGKNQ